MGPLTASQTVKIALALYVLSWLFAFKETRAVHRFFLGQIVMGEPRTNSTFFLPADKVIARGGRASKWQMLPGYKRALYRIEAIGGSGLGLYLYFWHRRILYGIAIGLATAVITAAVFFGRIQWGKRILTRDVLKPLHKMLAPIVEQEAHVSHRGWIDVPSDYATNESAKVTIALPTHFAPTAEMRKQLPPLVAARLGGEWDGEFITKGKYPQLVMRHAPNPPDSVRLPQLIDAMLSAPEYAPILGIGSHDKIISVDLNSDSPHVAFSMGSGGGKSTAVRGLAIQLLRNGAEVEILDIAKRGVSHLWAKRIPGVSIWRTPETAHNALVRLGKEMEGRYDEIYIDPAREFQFTRKILVFEELNASFKQLSDYWKSIRTKDDPKDSPAVTAFANILFAGRQGRINAFVVAQSFTARAIGGPEARENFASRILGRYSVNAWKMLAPEVWPMPRKSTQVGRVQMVTGGEAFATQVLYTTDEEAFEYATAENRERKPVETTLTTEAVSSERVYSLADAVREHIIPVEYEAAKKIRQRNPDFPRGNAATEKNIREWFANYVGGK